MLKQGLVFSDCRRDGRWSGQDISGVWEGGVGHQRSVFTCCICMSISKGDQFWVFASFSLWDCIIVLIMRVKVCPIPNELAQIRNKVRLGSLRCYIILGPATQLSPCGTDRTGLTSHLTESRTSSQRIGFTIKTMFIKADKRSALLPSVVTSQDIMTDRINCHGRQKQIYLFIFFYLCECLKFSFYYIKSVWIFFTQNSLMLCQQCVCGCLATLQQQ